MCKTKGVPERYKSKLPVVLMIMTGADLEDLVKTLMTEVDLILRIPTDPEGITSRESQGLAAGAESRLEDHHQTDQEVRHPDRDLEGAEDVVMDEGFVMTARITMIKISR